MTSDRILNDHFEKTLQPVLSLKPYFAWQTGIFSDMERAILRKEKEFVIYANINREKDFYKDFFKSIGTDFYYSLKENDPNNCVKPDDILKSFPQKILQDIAFLSRDNYHNEINGYVIGSQNDVWIHNDAHVSPLVEINVQNGPVIIDKNVRISSFCILNGPVFVGPDSILDRVMFSNSRAGRQCRLGGEISDCIIGDYTNKHHEGFLGHSIVGDWVNLGALTTTSDLKNNYGEIRLQYQNEEFPTNRIKFGSIIGDFVKTGIGSMLNTGTIIDIGSLLFRGFPDLKYIPPFFWGGATGQKYQQDKFLSDLEKIMARRNHSPDNFLKNQIQIIFKQVGR